MAAHVPDSWSSSQWWMSGSGRTLSDRMEIDYGPPPALIINTANIARPVFPDDNSSTTGQTVPKTYSMVSYSPPLSPSLEQEPVVPDRPIKIPAESFLFIIETGNETDLNRASNIVQTHLKSKITRLSTAESTELGETSYLRVTYEVRPQETSPSCLLSHLLNLRFPPNLKNTYILLQDPKIFNESLSDEMSVKLNSIDIGYRKQYEYISHWTIDYSWVNHWENKELIEFCRKNFKADFVFDQQAVRITLNVWNNNASHPKHKDKVDHYTLTMEQRSLRRIFVSFALQQNQTLLILESNDPLTIKKKQNGIEDVLNDLPKIHFAPDLRCRTVFRGKSYQDRAPEDVFFYNRHILLNLNISEDQTRQLISRLHRKTGVEVIGGSIEIMDYPIVKYMHWSKDINPCGSYLEERLRHFPQDKAVVLTMRLKALFGLGANINDQLLLDQNIYESFIEEVLRVAQQDFKKTKLLLESIIRFYQQTIHDAPFVQVFKKFVEKVANNELADPYADIGKDYEAFEEIELTPLGPVYKLPEIRLGNMVSRMLKKRKMPMMIRCSFRSETRQLLHWTLSGQTELGARKIDDVLKKTLARYQINGIEILGKWFTFFAASGSQQREEGYFSMESQQVDYVRRMIGKFEAIESPNKRESREGQPTSQSMECSIMITDDMWRVEEDIRSEGVVMTDGSGRISRELAMEIYRDKKLGECVPSGFQLRFHGCKGMLWIDNRLPGRQIVFRESQWKFDLGSDPYPYIQVVKYTGPQTTNLSANYINIIGQNAEIQGERSERITEGILDMNEKALTELFEAMKDEDKFRHTFTKLPFFIDQSKIGAEIGMIMHQDPFFRRLVSAHIVKSLSYLLHKNRLPVDPDMGRSAFGGPDDLEILAAEEVYFEATKNVNNKFPAPYTETVIYKGLGLIAKYPCCHAGDVRLVTFVDVPEYHGMRDKLIFSVKGGRPLADMLSGSDYDGDEFVIHQIEALFPARNEVSMDYTPTVPSTPSPKVKEMIPETWRAETYLKIAENNNMGLAAVCQLVKSDELGQESQVALSLTKTSSMYLDAPKSGILPPEIRRKWIQLDNGNFLPPEFPYRRPDFRSCSAKGPTYKSERINGKLHRQNRQLEFLISMREEQQKIEPNAAIYQIYIDFKQKNPREIENLRTKLRPLLESYNNRLQAIMTNGRIFTEAELFSNCLFTGLGFDNEEEEFGNMTHLKRAIELFSSFRQRFFDENADDGNYMSITKSETKFDDEDVLRRTVVKVTPGMRKTAVLCYIMAYELASKSKNPILSFAWIAYDVIGKALESIAANLGVEEDSIYQILQNELVALKVRNVYDYGYCSTLENYDLYLYRLLTDFTRKYGDDFQLVLFGLIKLAQISGLLNSQREGFNKELSRFVWIVLRLGIGSIGGLETVFRTNEIGQPIPIKIGECFLTLIGRLSSRKIFLLESTSYGEVLEGNNVNIYGVISREELRKIYETSRKSYYYLLFSQNMAVFDGHLPYQIVRERVPRIIELPLVANLKDVTEVLKKKTGAVEMILKRKDVRNKYRVTVLYRGSSDCEEALRRLVEIPPLKNPQSEEEQNNYFANNVYTNIMENN